MADLLNNAMSGLKAYQRALATTGHNIANASTEGFSRQRVIFAARPPETINAPGNGVRIAGIRRDYDSFLTNQLRDAVSQQQSLSVFQGQSALIDDILADPQGGITPALQNFFSGMQEVADDPGSIPGRVSMLAQASAMVERFRSLDQRFSEQALATNTRIKDMVNRINDAALSLRDVNVEILSNRSGQTGSIPPDLLDRRDAVLQELSGYVGVSVVENADQTINVFIGSGQTLVTNNNVFKIEALADSADASLLRINYQGISGNGDISGSLQGGELGGLIEFSRNFLGTVRNQLGQVAIGIAMAMNEQHRQGMDLNNNLGGDLFNIAGPLVLGNNNNTGTATVAATLVDESVLTDQNYALSFDGANWTMTADDGSSSITGAGPLLALDGFSLNIGGAAAAGDQFIVRPTRLGAQSISMAIINPREVAAALPVTASANLNNASTAGISRGDVLDIGNANLQDPIEIRFNTPPNTYDIRNATTGAVLLAGEPYGSGSNIDYNGWRVQITGTPQAGDRFNVSSNAGGSSDNRNALALAALQSAPSLSAIANVSNNYPLVGAAGRNDLTFVDDVGGSQDGITLTIQGRTYELDNNATVGAGNIAIAFTANDTAATLAGLVQAQFATDIGANLLQNISATAAGNDVQLLSDVITSTTSHTDVTTTLGNLYAIAPTGTANGSTLSIGGVTYEFRFDNEAASPGTTKVSLGALGFGTGPDQAQNLAAAINVEYTAGNSSVSATVAGNVVNTLGAGSPSANFQEVYSALVAEVGARSRQAQVGAEAQEAVVNSVQDRKESVSGVNLDEEAANLIRYQQAYQAAARAIAAADDMFQTFLGMI